MARYSDQGRLKAIVVGSPGDRLHDDIVASVAKASLSLSSSQTSQLTLAVEDHQLELVTGGFLGKRTPVSYAGLRFEVAVREIVTVGSGIPALQLTCRAAVVQAMKRRRGVRAWSSLSYTQWARMEVEAAGGRFVGESSARKRQIVRKDEKGQPPESSWDVLQRGAQECGFVAFESEGVVYFGRPSWLAARASKVHLYWSGGGGGNTTAGLLGVPTIRDSDDDQKAGYTGSVSVDPGLAEQLVPAKCAVLHGVGPYDAAYLVGDVTLDLAATSPASITIATPVDPEPAPADDGPAQKTAGGKSIPRSSGGSSSRKPKPKKPTPGHAFQGHSHDPDLNQPDQAAGTGGGAVPDPPPKGQRSTGGGPGHSHDPG